MPTIRHLEASLEDELRPALLKVLPHTAPYSLKVEIYEGSRKKRRDASVDGWRLPLGEVRIKFDVAANDSTAPAPSQTAHIDVGSRTSQPQVPEPEGPDLVILRVHLIKGLDAAEARPGFDFVALKWFRDLILPAESAHLADSSSLRDQLLRSAIQDGVILTSKVPNPKAPAFPTTAVRLNRQHPAVIPVLGEDDSGSSDFQPIRIRGEALSDTALRDRR